MSSLSLKFVTSSLNVIAASKDAHHNAALGEAVKKALDAIKAGEPEFPDPEIIFAPLQLATRSGSIPLATTALDCIGKLISYSYFSIPSASSPLPAEEDSEQPQTQTRAPLIERSIDTICDCFQGETTPVEIQLQIVKSLLAAVLNDKIVVHGAGLLKAIRQVYNVFLLSRNSANQQVAQGTLTQMVGTVFERVKTRLQMKEARFGLAKLKGGVAGSGSTSTFHHHPSDLAGNGTHRRRAVSGSLDQSADHSNSADMDEDGDEDGDEDSSSDGSNEPSSNSSQGDDAADVSRATNGKTEDGNTPNHTVKEGAKLTLKDLEHRKSFDDSSLGDGPTMVTQLQPRHAAGTLGQPMSDQASVSDGVGGMGISGIGDIGGHGSPHDKTGSSHGGSGEHSPETLDAEDEVYIRDAYLVFRSFCNLSTKVLPPDQLYDLRGQPMRSKLISLHLIHTLLNNHISVFTSPLCTITNTKNNEPTNFLQAIKFYLCLSITRNGASSIDRVFEVCCEIFWLMLKYMRPPFKKEIEVFLNEIYLALLARKTAPLSQKLYVVTILNRLTADPRALVETYLNYDCDRNVDNIFQTIVEHLSKFAITPVPITADIERGYEEKHGTVSGADWQIKNTLPPSLTVTHIVPQHEPESEFPKEYVMKRISLDSLVESLRSMVNWSQAGRPTAHTGANASGQAGAGAAADGHDGRGSLEDLRDSIGTGGDASAIDTPMMPSTPVMDDDPEHLEKEKARKTAMALAIKAFNFKPKKGIKMLVEQGFIASDAPADIAQFLIREERLDKAQVGEYLGEGDARNIEIMHAFVDTMDFTKKRFVDALRHFLQSFRLPGEAQKIDRFMLKFAERYNDGNPNAFANADTAYVLAYSVILLNTDLHSSNVTKRMTKPDFIRNNRGINDNADLPEEYLLGIYDEIASNEIVLHSERASAAAAGTLPTTPASTGLAANIGHAFSNVGRDLQREAYVQQSEEIALRSEQLFKNLFRSQRRNAARAGGGGGSSNGSGDGAVSSAGGKFMPATSFRHIGPMFDVTWMSYFSAFSSQMQNAHNLALQRLCLEGMQLATQIACQFELATPREAFISALRNAAGLNNVHEMQAKNVAALRVLLELGHTEGNYLRQSWKDILISVSQLERLQLLASGVDGSAVPDVSKARFAAAAAAAAAAGGDGHHPPSRRQQQQRRNRAGNHGSFSSTASGSGAGGGAGGGSGGGFASAAIAEELTSDETLKSVDRIFTNTANLDGESIVHFARALTAVSWDEIKVSGSNEHPRMFSLQKIVEISYYNMTRVRFEWTNIWGVLGDHFNRVGCHANEAIVFFALDSLRQLSMRFLEIEELPGFKFQKDFLKPFEHVMSNSSNIHVKDMALRCLIQMTQARGENIRSGWRTMFGAFTVAARDLAESIVSMAFENVTQVYRTRFGVVIVQGAFTDLIVCLTEFSKNMRFQKKSLQAMETLKSVIPTMLRTPECPLSQSQSSQRPSAHGANGANGTNGDASERVHAHGVHGDAHAASRTSVEEGFWFPVLFAFHDVLMTGEDLEVRSNALNYFFETLLRYGGDFTPDFWDILWRQQLYPIFLVLRSRPEMSNVLNHEELSVWLSTTMIQALRNMITLFTHYFDALECMLDRFLELLGLCILQENDTIARIGSNCLQQLILQNVAKFSPAHWSKIVGAFCELFERTTAYQLFSATTATPTSPGSGVGGGGGTLDFGYPQSPTRMPKEDGKGAHGEELAHKDGRAQEDKTDTASLLSVVPTEDTAPPAYSQTEHDETDENGENGENGEHGEKDEKDDTSTLAVDGPGSAPAKKTAEEGSSLPLEDYRPASQLQQQPVVVTAARRRFFNRIISRCVLQLLMIETVNELFGNEAVYRQIPSVELLRLMGLLKKSFLFARRFNTDKQLRMRLWREGFMKQPPNLLKQESGSAATYVAILFKMYADEAPERQQTRADVEKALVPLCKDILHGYVALEDESQHRNIMAWRPVVVDVLDGFAQFSRPAFLSHLPDFYPAVVELLASKELSGDLRAAMVHVLRRVGEVGLGIGFGHAGLAGEVEGAAGTANTANTANTASGQGLAGGGRRRRDSTLSTASTEASVATVDYEGGDASTKFMGRRMHSPVPEGAEE